MSECEFQKTERKTKEQIKKATRRKNRRGSNKHGNYSIFEQAWSKTSTAKSMSSLFTHIGGFTLKTRLKKA